MSSVTRRFTAMGLPILVALVTGACGGRNTPPGPSAPSPQPATLAGVWAGAVGTSAEDGRSLGLVWDAERQGDGRLSGNATLSTLSSSSVRLSFPGTMTSVRSGAQFVLTFRSESTSPNDSPCAVFASGRAHLENFSLIGDLDVTYRSCDDLHLQPPASTHLELLKRLN